MSLAKLDSQWSEHDHSKIVVSLTTIPERIDRLKPTLKSLLFQTRPPQKIYLNIPYQTFRDGSKYVIPKWMEDLKSLEIVRITEDYGPASKFIPTLESQPEDQLILVVDDDHLYPPRFIEEFESSHQKYGDYILAAGGWRVPKDLTDRSTKVWMNIFKIPPAPVKGSKIKQLYPTNIVQGYAGYLIKPNFFNLDELKDFSKAPNEIRYVDDVWISAHSKVRKFVIPIKRYCYNTFFTRKFYKSTSLAKISNKGGKSNSERYNTIGIRYFKDRWEMFDKSSS